LWAHYSAEASSLNYVDLDDLLENNPQAKTYFDTLSPNMKQQLRGQAKNIESYEGLRNYADSQNQSSK
jgi:uncharacterized protein YdeI (YjbR/CyaY-like superfamily)